MFSKKPDLRVAQLDEEITRVLAVMARIEPDSEEYTAASDNWTKLCAERDTLLPKRFSKDQLLLVGGNLLVALVVVGHERAAVITTKLPTFLNKATR